MLSDPRPKWFRRNPRLTIFIFSDLICILILLFAEIFLRLNGTIPGKYGENIHWTAVDSLIVRNDYEADGNGIMHVSDAKVKWLHRWLDTTAWPADTHHLNKLGLEFTLWQLALDAAFENRNSGNDHYNGLNSNGFRSPEFARTDSGKPTILLLGDSFTWGLSAKPLSNSFADLLLKNGFLIYNAGIVGADPVQYLRIAEWLVPLLQPELIVLNYFMGNDDLHTFREEAPFKTHYHVTNAGWLWAYSRGFYMDANSAYDYIAGQVVIPDQDENAGNRFLASTALGTRLYAVLVNWELIRNPLHRIRPEDAGRDTFRYHEMPVSESYVRKVRTLCDSLATELIISVIPDYKQIADNSFEIRLNRTFMQLEYVTCDSLTTNMYHPDPDGHFTNEGHRIYANFLEREIRKILKRKNGDRQVNSGDSY